MRLTNKIVLFWIFFSISLFFLAFSNKTYALQIRSTFEFAKSLNAFSTKIIHDDGYVYMAGSFSGTIDTDLNAGTNNINSNGNNDIFLSKYNNSGDHQWTINIGGSGQETIKGINIDSNGNIFLVGLFQGTVDFDPSGGTDNQSGTTDPGEGGIFVSKYNSSGTYQWTRTVDVEYNNTENISIGISASNNISIGGHFNSSTTVDFDPTGGTDNKTALGPGNTGFVSIYNNDGSYNLTRFIGTGGSNGFRITKISIDSTSNIFATGSLSGTIDLDPGASTVNVTGSSDEMFIVKYDSSMNYITHHKLTSGITPYDIEINSNGDIIVVGNFSGTRDFDPSGTTENYSAGGVFDCFITKYNNSLSYQWTKVFGGSLFEYIYDVEIGVSNNIYISGDFDGTTDFNPAAATNSITSNGGVDAFFSSLDNNGNFRFATRFGGNSTDRARSITLDENDYIYIGGEFLSTVDFDPGTGVQNLSGGGNFFVRQWQEYESWINNISSESINALDVSSNNPSSSVITDSLNALNNREVRVRKNTGSIPIANLTVDMRSGRDWSNQISADSDAGSNKSYFHVPGGVSALPGSSSTYTLYVPKSASDTEVYVCPNATNLSQVEENCAGKVSFSVLSLGPKTVGSATNVVASTTNIGGQDYWAISGVNGTGAQSISGSAQTPSMRVVLRDSEAVSIQSDVEFWFDTPIDITANTYIYMNYENTFTGGANITTSDVTVTCDADGLDPLSGTVMTNAIVNVSENGVLEIDLGIDTCANWVVVDIHGGGGNSLTNPNSSGNYSWSVMVDIGDNLEIDLIGATLAYVANDNDVNITSFVPPVIDLELFQANSDTLLGTPNTCSLGVLSLNIVSTCIYDIGVGTNNASGVSVYVTSSGDLNDGLGNNINGFTGILTAGVEGYGFYISELGGGEFTAAGSFGTAYQQVPTTVSLFSTTNSVGNGTNNGQSAIRMEVRHGATMSVDTVRGNYSHTITYTAFTN